MEILNTFWLSVLIETQNCASAAPSILTRISFSGKEYLLLLGEEKL